MAGPTRRRGAARWPGAVVSAGAALREYGLRSGPNPVDVLVLVARTSGARSCGIVRVRRTARLPRPEPRLGPPLAPPPRAVPDAARTMTRLDDVRAIVTETVRRRMATVAELLDELKAGRRNGSHLLRVAIDDVSRGAWSAPEAEAAALLRSAGLTGFVQNVAVPAGGRNHVVDFLWRGLRAVLEIDSEEHHRCTADWRATMDRHLALETAGYSVVHRPPHSLRDPSQFVAAIRAWLAGRRIQVGSR